MKTIKRNEAIEECVNHILEKLSATERELYIYDSWSIDTNEPAFHRLPEQLRDEIITSDEPLQSLENECYNPLITISLAHNFTGVTNEYLEETLKEYGFKTPKVIGTVEILEECPCCGYRTLVTRNNFDVCRLCRWEDNGTNKPETYSGPNHMTLADARSKFESLKHTLPLHKFSRSS